MKRSAALLLYVCAFLVATLPAFAQFETASVLGYVRDTSGAAIPNSKVTLVNEGTGISKDVVSDEQGAYQFTSLQIGQYHITAQATGFNQSTTQVFSVTVNARQRVDVTLAVGSASQTVEVSAAASLLESETSERGQVVSSREISNLPLNGRSYADLALLVPGVRKNLLENQTTSSRDASFNVNGQRSEFNNFLLDGLDNNAYGTSNQGFSNQAIPPAPDAINEFRVETDNYSAEYGRASGAVVNVSIASGTNKFHGKAWEYNRNTNLNAEGPFLPANNPLTNKPQKPVLIRNQFGGSFGGPIFHDRTFFFADYEGMRQISKQLAQATVPTALQRQGIFVNSTGGTVELRNPVTGTYYPNGVVPQSDWSSFAGAVINALPAPNVAGALSNNYVSMPRGTIQDDKGDIRLDHNFSSKLTSFFRYSEHQGAIFDPPNITGAAGGNSNGNVHIFNQQVAAGSTYIINQNSILDARVAFTWTEGGKTPYGLGETSLLTANGITGLPTDPKVARSLNVQNVTSYSQFGAQGSNPQFQNPFVINPKVNYSWLKGKHSLKFGYEYQSITTSIDDFNPVYGQDTYNGGFSYVSATATDPGSGSKTDTGVKEAMYLTDFLTGARSGYQLNNYRIIDYNQRMHFLYVQDDFKLTPRLTINAGLRYELATPQWVSGNHLANFDPTTNSLIQASSGSLYSRALVHLPKLDFAPRFGFSFALDPKTVIRSGYGLNFNQFNREGGENLLAYNGPYIVNSSITQVAPFPVTSTSQQLCTGNNFTGCFRTMQQGYPENFATSANFSTLLAQTRYIPKNIPTGYVQTWHLGVQREIAHNTVFDISYVGSHGVKIWVLADQNQAAPNTVVPGSCDSATQKGCLSLQARRPISTFTGIEVSLPAGFMNYNALQTKIEHRYSNGLYLLNSFTWSKAIDNASGHLDTPNSDNSRINLANPLGERSTSAYDQPLNDTLTLIWDLPYGRGRQFGSHAPWALQTLLGGWQFNAINQATSGQTSNLVYTEAAYQDVSDLLAYRPNVSGNPVLGSGKRVKSARNVQYLNTATVSVPTDPSTPYGNAGRNTVRGYPYYQLDTGLHKNFTLWNEGTLLDFRAEAFNVLNQTNYQAPDSNRSDGAFGQITTFFPPRQLQLALRLTF